MSTSQIQRQINALNSRIVNFDRSIVRIQSQKTQYQSQLTSALASLNNRIALIEIQKTSTQTRINDWIASLDQRIAELEAQKETIQQQIQALQNSIFNPSPAYSQHVLNVHNQMMAYFNNTLVGTPEDGQFVIPFIPANYNLRLDSSEYKLNMYAITNPEFCAYSNLGADANGQLTYIEIIGNFSIASNLSLIPANATGQQIVSSGRYVPRQIRLPSAEIGQPMQTINISNGNLAVLPSASLNNIAYNNVLRVVSGLTTWAKRTAFLTYAPFCPNYYFSTYSEGFVAPGTMIEADDRKNSSVPQVPTASSKDSNIVLPNSLQKEYYDRLYDFMSVNGYTNTNTSSTVLNLLQNFSVSWQ